MNSLYQPATTATTDCQPGAPRMAAISASQPRSAETRYSLLLRFVAPLLIVVLWGSLPVAVKLGVTHYSPLVFATLRALVSSALMIIFLVTLHRGRIFRILESRRLHVSGIDRPPSNYCVFLCHFSGRLNGVSQHCGHPDQYATDFHRIPGTPNTWRGADWTNDRRHRLRIHINTLGCLRGFEKFSISLGGYFLLLTGAACWAAASLLYKKRLARRGEPLVATAAQLWRFMQNAV